MHPERARDDVLRKIVALLARQLGHRLEVLVDQRVITRQLLDAAVAHAIAAAVTDVRHVHVVMLGHEEERERQSYARNIR